MVPVKEEDISVQARVDEMEGEIAQPGTSKDGLKQLGHQEEKADVEGRLAEA